MTGREAAAHKEVFVEADWMPGHEFQKEAQIMVMDTFARNGIALHIDHGWTRGGEEIEYSEFITFSYYPGVMNYNAPDDFYGYSAGDSGSNDHDDWASLNLKGIERWGVHE